MRSTLTHSIPFFLCSVLWLLWTPPLATAKTPKPAPKVDPLEEYTKIDCQSTREYITAYNYLNQQKEKTGLNEKQIRKLAEQISQNCTDSAKRFIRAFNLLSKVELGSKIALKVSLKLSNRSSSYTSAFLSIFKQSYLKEFLDLDLQSSLKLALALSTEFEGAPTQALEDFSHLTKFCTDNSSTNLPLSDCAQLATRLTLRGGHFKESLYDSFLDTYEYLHSKSTLNLPVAKAIQLAENIVTHSPHAFENFKLAYEFGLSSKGLNESAQLALEFAQTLTKFTVRNVPIENYKVNGETEGALPARTPASSSPPPK